MPAGTYVLHVHCSGRRIISRRIGRILRIYCAPLQVVQGDDRDARAGEFDVEEVVGGVGIDRQRGVTGHVICGAFRAGLGGRVRLVRNIHLILVTDSEEETEHPFRHHRGTAG